MRGLAIQAPTQTNSLFWKCSLKSSGADRSQEQRGNGPLLHFCFLSGLSPCSLSVRWQFSWPPKHYLRRADVWRNQEMMLGHVRSCNGNRVAADSRAKPSVISLSFSHMSCQQMTCTLPDPLSRWSLWVVSGLQCSTRCWNLMQPHWQEYNSLWGPGLGCWSVTLPSMLVISIQQFFCHKIKEMSHMNCGVLTQYQAHMFIGISQWKTWLLTM